MSKRFEKSFFITLEGGEGSGKTTQINRLAEALTGLGYRVLTTREPGGTPEGEKIRALFVRDTGMNWSPMAEVLLILAARAMHVERVVRPALEEKNIVICDRFTDSTTAYQGYGRGLELSAIDSLTKSVIGELKPDLTFILDLPPGAGLSRSTKRLARDHQNENAAEDRFEKLELSFHDRVREGFLDIGKREPERCIVVDATTGVDKMARIILDATLNKLGN